MNKKSHPEDNFKAPHKRVGTSWKEFIIGKPLTDARIEYYRKMGYYSPEFRQARREMWERKALRGQRRGNFDLINGRMIYRPD